MPGVQVHAAADPGNCFSHAFSGSLPRPKALEILARKDADDLSILIRDNSLGISKEESAHLAQALSAPGEPDGAQHLSMRSIHQRIIDSFGQRYGIRMAALSPGLCVEIRCPIVGGT